jgi:translation initiation factor 6 (eIF-6)
LQFFTVLVVINSATLVLPWNVEEEEEMRKNRARFLFIVTALSAFANIFFALEVSFLTINQ